ncbi:thermonuclease family protein [Roseovarius aestuarii]|uniref:thermonuclease family protein n=1 Tax=Roseovarius aestuarii TaxID=475083 RepID=UPI001CBD889B|nr:thermonuclease family protein [Roseovarius aestuarii]
MVILVILAGVFIVAFRSRETSTDRYTPPPRNETPKTTEIVASPAQARPFDHSTAKPSPVPLSIEGPARIIDGDTVVIKKTQIRLFGIDAPELDHPYGQKAKWALVGLCKGQAVRAEILEKDAHGRTVAKCFLPDGRDLSSEMVKQGLAIDWPKFSGGKYSHLEVTDARKKMWLADARQKGRMHVWEKFEAKKRNQR